MQRALWPLYRRRWAHLSPHTLPNVCLLLRCLLYRPFQTFAARQTFDSWSTWSSETPRAGSAAHVFACGAALHPAALVLHRHCGTLPFAPTDGSRAVAGSGLCRIAAETGQVGSAAQGRRQAAAGAVDWRPALSLSAGRRLAATGYSIALEPSEARRRPPPGPWARGPRGLYNGCPFGLSPPRSL